MYRIAHISDPHLCFADHNGGGKAFIKLMENIREKNCDHVVITGDIADNPLPEDFRFAAELFKEYELTDSGKVTVVPGNHDIFGGAEKGIDGIKFIYNNRQTDYKKNLDMFTESFAGSFDPYRNFPFVKILDNIALIGINSIDKWSLDKNPEGSNGRITDRDYTKLEKIFKSKKLKGLHKIILMHHHFALPDETEENKAHPLWLKVIEWKMKLRGKKKLIRLFEKHKVKLVLHGHTHINEIYTEGKITFVNSSASSIPLTDDQNRFYHIIEIPGIEDDSKNIKIEKVQVL